MKVDKPRFDFLGGYVRCSDCPYGVLMQQRPGPDWTDCNKRANTPCPTAETYAADCTLADHLKGGE